jgi:hypothetical protein
VSRCLCVGGRVCVGWGWGGGGFQEVALEAKSRKGYVCQCGGGDRRERCFLEGRWVRGVERRGAYSHFIRGGEVAAHTSE